MLWLLKQYELRLQFYLNLLLTLAVLVGLIAVAAPNLAPGEAQVIPAAGIRIDEQHSY